MKYPRVDMGQMEATINMHGGYDNWLRMLRGEIVVRFEQVGEAQFVLDLNYGAFASQEEMFSGLLSEGKYNGVSPDVTFEHYRIEPCSGIWRVTCDLVHPNQSHRTEDALFQMGSLGLRRPRIEHCLAFGAKYPEEQRKHPIVIACAPWVYRFGHGFLPVLDVSAGHRELNLNSVEDGWIPYDRWLAVRTEVLLGS